MKKILAGFIITLFCLVFAGPAFPQAGPNTPYKLGSSKQLRQDPQSNALTAGSFAEERLHSGKHFFSKSTASYLADAVVDLVFTTPATDTKIHAKAQFTADAVFTVELYEDAVFTGGTPIVTFNNDRDSSTSPELIALSGTTVSDPGTLIWIAKLTGATFIGVSDGFGYEILAKSDANYLFRITKATGAGGNLDTNFFWFED